MPPLLTKTLYLAGRRCAKLLWFSAHEPDAEELIPDPGLLWLLEQGKEVTRHARTAFPALRAEVTYAAGGMSVRTDLVEGTAAGVHLIEVKGANARTADHVDDVAFQVHVAEEDGERVAAAELVTLDKDATYPAGDSVFVREDITALVRPLAGRIASEATAMRRILGGARPEVPTGLHCLQGGECAFIDRCWPRPRDHVTHLYGIHKTAAIELVERGLTSVRQLDDATLTALKPPPGIATGVANDVRRNQVAAEVGQTRIVRPGLGAALAALATPIVHLDFETVNFALPRYSGTGPWAQIPVQFSVHLERADGVVEHREFLADGAGDPRPALIDALLQACGPAGTILAWYASFESSRIKELAAAFPERAAELDALRVRIVDLLPVVRNHVYDPAFEGSFSLKAVLPALVPGLGYDDLVIRNGGQAMGELARLLDADAGMGAEERMVLRRDLLAYCERDTFAMVRLLATLRDLALRSGS